MTEERLYRVIWEIDIPALTPEQAVVIAVNYLGPMEPARWCYSTRDRETGEVKKHEGEELFNRPKSQAAL